MKVLSPVWQRLNRTALALGVVAGVYLWAALIYLPPRVYWTPDVGLKVIQASAGRGLDFSVAYPGQALDPAFQFVPFRETFYFIARERLHFAQPPIISILSQPLIAWLGRRSEALVSLMAGWVTVVLATHLTQRVGGPGWLGALLAGLATPLMFYSVPLWEHTLAVALALGALVLVLDPSERRASHLIVSGLLVGLAASTRKELLLLAPVMLVLIARRERRWQAAAIWLAACGAPLFAWWAYTFIITGHLVPPEFRISTSPGLTAEAYFLRTGLRGLADFVFDPRAEGLGEQALVAAAVYVLMQRAPQTWWRELAQVLALLWLGAAAWGGLLSAVQGGGLFGWLSVSPYLVVGTWFTREENATLRSLRVIALGYYALVMLSLGWLTAAGAFQAGLEWGTRFALLVFPLSVPLAARGLHALQQRALSARLYGDELTIKPPRWAPFKSTWAATLSNGLARLHLILIAALIALSVWMQALGVSLMRNPAVNAEVREALLAVPEQHVVTNLWWLSAAAPDLYLTRPLFLIEDEMDLAAWLRAAEARGAQPFAFVSYGALSESVAAPLAPPGVQLTVIETRALANGMVITRVELKPR